MQLPDGRRIPLRCNRVGCPSCGKRHALIALEMVRDTSHRMGNPDVAVTLTSVDPFRELGRAWSKDTEQVIRALRRRWPDSEYLGFMEWTTGRAARSGGFRRPHMHLLARGLPREAAEAAESIVRAVWHARTGANRVEVAPLRAAEDGVAYLALHHLKPLQAAPVPIRYRRMRPSRGWWGTDAAGLRRRAAEAVADITHRKAVLKARRDSIAELIEQGFDAQEAHDLVLGPVEDPAPIPDRPTGALVVRLEREDKYVERRQNASRADA